MTSTDFKNLMICEDETVTVNAKELQEYILAYEKCQICLADMTKKHRKLTADFTALKQNNELLQALLDEKKSKQIHVDLRA
jgi:hypothetical protein